MCDLHIKFKEDRTKTTVISWTIGISDRRTDAHTQTQTYTRDFISVQCHGLHWYIAIYLSEFRYCNVQPNFRLKSPRICCRSDPLQRDQCGTVRNDRVQHLWISLMCISAIGFIIKVQTSFLLHSEFILHK